MKWLGFIILVLIESLAIFGLSLEKIGFTVPQAILISCYVVLLIITITGFIITHFVNLQNERENEFRILVEKLRGQEEAIKTVKEQVFRIGQNVLISEEKLEDIKEEFKRLKWCELEGLEGCELEGLEGLVAEVLFPLLSLLFLLSAFLILGK